MNSSARSLPLIALLALYACGGASAAAPPAAPAPSGVYAQRSMPMTGALLYVLNYSSGSVTEYPFASGGDVAPIRDIAGVKTKIFIPEDLAVDGAGYIFVANRGDRTFPAAVNVFSPLANGNVAPIRALKRPIGTFLLGMWADAAGYVYLAEYKQHDVAIFAPGASGYAKPIRLIAGSNTGLLCPFGVATDAAGNLFVADYCTKAILEFAPTADGNVAPIAEIKGRNTHLVAPNHVKIGSDGTIYATDYKSGMIFAFAAGSNGNVAPIAVLSPPSGEYFIGSIATHSADLIAGIGGVPNYTWAVNTYKTGSTITLLRSLAGPDTALDAPWAEAVR